MNFIKKMQSKHGTGGLIMARLIDTRAAANKIHEYMEDFPRAETRLATCRVILSMLGDENQIPTIDPVHAAGACYCWECRFADIGGNGVESWRYCYPTDFCSYGQRREDA